MRTTVDIDDPILKEVKKLQKTRGMSLGRLVSDLLAQGLHEMRRTPPPPPARRWICKEMGARFDLADKEALQAALDRDTTDAKEDRKP
jgi:hypothetical protein